MAKQEMSDQRVFHFIFGKVSHSTLLWQLLPPSAACRTNVHWEEGSGIVICRALRHYRANFSLASELEVLPTRTKLS